MLALSWDGERVAVAERGDPDDKPGWAIVGVRLAGVCNTDLEIVRGYMGFRGILGHELVGEVVSGPPEWLGKRVVCGINFACGACATCARGLGRHCEARTVMGILGADGAFAERIAVPVANLHEVPIGVSDEAAVFAEPLAAACEVLEQVHVHAGTEAVVLGDGKLGLLVAQVLFNAGAQVTAVGRHEDKLAILAKRGIRTVLAADFAGERADLVVEATGTAEGFARAIAATRPRGTLVLKSTVARPKEQDLAPIVIHEITVVGSRCGSFPPALRALEVASVDVASLISDRFDLADGVRALERASSRSSRKVLVNMC